MVSPDRISSHKIESDKPLEVEKKFLIKRLPDNLEQYPMAKIRQGYLAIMPDGSEIRLRQKNDKYYQTLKSG